MRERPSPEINTPQGEDEGEGPTTAQDNQIQLRQEKETLPVEEDSSGFTQATGGSATTLNRVEEGAGNGPFADPPLEVLLIVQSSYFQLTCSCRTCQSQSNWPKRSGSKQ